MENTITRMNENTQAAWYCHRRHRRAGQSLCGGMRQPRLDLFLTDLNPGPWTVLQQILKATYEVNVLTQACDLTEPASRGENFIDQFKR